MRATHCTLLLCARARGQNIVITFLPCHFLHVLASVLVVLHVVSLICGSIHMVNLSWGPSKEGCIMSTQVTMLNHKDVLEIPMLVTTM